jgi:hypothetical protein
MTSKEKRLYKMKDCPERWFRIDLGFSEKWIIWTHGGEKRRRTSEIFKEKC